jgi:DNA repair protein RadC
MSALPTPLPLRRRREPLSTPSRRALPRLGAERVDDLALVATVCGSLGAARAALDGFDGMVSLARAEAAELALLPGMGMRRAARLAAAFELGRRAATSWPEPAWRIRTPADVGERLLPGMGGLEREELRVLLLNTKNVVTAMRTVYLGNLAGSAVRVGEVFRDAVRQQAAAIVVVHNHPSGDPSPSGDDLRITGELADAGRLLDIELLDHVVIGQRTWISLRSMGAGIGSIGA